MLIETIVLGALAGAIGASVMDDGKKNKKRRPYMGPKDKDGLPYRRDSMPEIDMDQPGLDSMSSWSSDDD